MPEKIKVAVADDHEIFRNGIQTILARIEKVQVLCACSNGAELLAFLNSNEPDIILMDIKMPVLNGIEAARRALGIRPAVKIIALTMFGDEDYLQEMIQAGAKGFLLKNITGRDLEHALTVIHAGGNYYSEELLGFFTRKYIQDIQPETDESRITKREFEVLQLVAGGLTNQEIADKLFISKRTVDGHKNNLIVKTGSKNIVDLLIYSIRNGLVKIS